VHPPGARNSHPHGRMSHHVYKITGHIATAHRAQQGKWQAGSSFPRKESTFHSWPRVEGKISLFLSLCSRAYSLLRRFILRARGSMPTHPSCSRRPRQNLGVGRGRTAPRPQAPGSDSSAPHSHPGNLASDVLHPIVYRSRRQSHSKSQRPGKHKHTSSLIILYDVLSVIRVVTIVNRVKIFYLGFFS
jgi:hypothetical protein